MSRIEWDQIGQKVYETGVDHGVLFVQNSDGAYPLGVPWNGLISVTESPTGATNTSNYADNQKYMNQISIEEFEGTVEAYTYPPEFGVCDGSAAIAKGIFIGQQTRSSFGLCYRSLVGNDIQNTKYGSKIHMIYGAVVAPSEKGYTTINDSPDAITFSWSITTTPVAVPGFEPTSTLTIDTTLADTESVKILEDILYGTADVEPRLPLPAEIIQLVGNDAVTNSIAG